MRSTRFWVILTAVLLTAAAAAAIIVFRMQPSGSVANIYRDGECIYSIDLNAPEDHSFTIEGESGVNVISVEKGRICISEADCPDQVCVHQGWISNGVVPVVCLPYKLVIQIEDSAPETGIDGLSR